MAGLQKKSPTPSSSSEPSFKEKATFVDTGGDEEESASALAKSSDDEDEKSLFVNGEPVITSGRDVSQYLVDLRDDEDPPFTFRSIVLGTMIGGLGAALYQVCSLLNLSVRVLIPASRSIFSSPSHLQSRQCFFYSLFTRSVFFGLPFSHAVLG
jgi:hypothetical protein